jgi:hypothetical protein
MKLFLINLTIIAALYAPMDSVFADKIGVKSPTEIIADKVTLCDKENKGLRGIRSAACTGNPQAKALRTANINAQDNADKDSKGLRNIPIITAADCGPNEMFVEVDIFTDEFPTEISWEVYDRVTLRTYMIGGSYTTPNEYTIVDGACVPDTCDVAFAIFDSYGDGLRSFNFPQFEDGYYNVFVNEDYDHPLLTSHSNGDFLVERRSFCPFPGSE